jgi:hypothetical protein
LALANHRTFKLSNSAIIVNINLDIAESSPVKISDSLTNSTTTPRLFSASNPKAGGFHKGVNEWFNTSSFVQPAMGDYGNSSRDILRAPGVENVDASMFKSISLIDRLNLQTRLEGFNLFNHTNLGAPNATVPQSASLPNPSYGTIGSSRLSGSGENGGYP